MNDENLFKQDWQDCLRAHYAYVVREQDMNNERSLVTVLLQTGFDQEDIDLMRAALGWVIEPPPVEISPEPAPELQIADPVENVAEPTVSEPEPAPPSENAEPDASANVSEAAPVREAKKPAKPTSKKTQDNPPEPPKQMSLF